MPQTPHRQIPTPAVGPDPALAGGPSPSATPDLPERGADARAEEAPRWRIPTDPPAV